MAVHGIFDSKFFYFFRDCFSNANQFRQTTNNINNCFKSSAYKNHKL